MSSVANAVNTTVQTVAQPGCWDNFVSGASQVACWCGRQISTIGSAIWAGAQKVATFVAAFLSSAATFLAAGVGVAAAFVKMHAKEFAIGGLGLAAGVGITLLVQHLCK